MGPWRTVWRYGIGAAAIVVLLWFPFVRDSRVPLLWAADLGFHELGHMLAIPFGQTIHFLAGSTTQVLVPLGLAGYFWLRQRDAMAAGLMLGWTAAAAHDASVYIADAPYQRLPLIGGHHDWNWLLSHWDALGAAGSIARVVWFCGLFAGVAGLWLALAPLVERLRHRHRERVEQGRRATLPVRPARRSVGQERAGDE